MNQKIRTCIKRLGAGIDLDGLADTDSLLEAGVLDSLGIMQLVPMLESQFQIVVEPEELLPENFDSVQCIAAFVSGKSGSGIA